MRGSSDTLDDALGALARAGQAVTELVEAVEPLDDAPARQAAAVVAGEIDRLRRRLELLDVAWRAAVAYRTDPDLAPARAPAATSAPPSAC